MSDDIELKSVKDLIGMKFYIPKYQRGYHWIEQQVLNLLNDIKEFIGRVSRKPNEHGIYYLQPLAVKKKGDLRNVIDGHQRLTTIRLIQFKNRGGSMPHGSEMSLDEFANKRFG